MTRHHADFLTAYTAAFTPRGEAPERFHFWTAVATIGGAIRRRAYIEQRTYRYFPNFYVLLVGPPGLVKKSTTINIGTGLLREVPNVIIGADCATWQSFVEEVANARDMFAEGGSAEEFAAAYDAALASGEAEDATAAALMATKTTVTCALTLGISEFGTFFDPNDRQMVNILTELFDCKLNSAFVKRTKTQGSDHLMNPFVNMIAGTTPTWIADNFKGRFGGWGLSSRMMFLYCDEKERDVAWPADLWEDKYEDTIAALKEDIVAISRLHGPMEVTPAAKHVYTQWYREHGQRVTMFNRHPHHDRWLEYYFARKADHVLKVALVLSVSRSDDMIITPTDITAAIARCDEIELEIANVFASRSEMSREAELNDDVWNGLCRILIAHSERIEEDQFFSYTTRFMSGGKANDFLKHRLAAKWLENSQEDGRRWLCFGPNARLSAPIQRERDEARHLADRDEAIAEWSEPPELPLRPFA